MDFNKLVKTIAEPTLLFFGFAIKQDIKGILVYNYEYLTLTMSYDYSSSYQVDMTLLFKEKGLFYGYSELKEYFSKSKAKLSTFQIKDESALIKWIEEVNKFLNDNLNSIIENQEEIQMGLEELKQCQIYIYEKESNDRLLAEGVEKYWKIKDYSGLVKFLKTFKGEFRGSIKKKYEYSLKMIGAR